MRMLVAELLGGGLSKVLDEVERGETFAVARNGRVIAYLISQASHIG